MLFVMYQEEGQSSGIKPYRIFENMYITLILIYKWILLADKAPLSSMVGSMFSQFYS